MDLHEIENLESIRIPCHEAYQRNSFVEQVKNGLEQLIRSWDTSDRAVNGELLKEMTEDRIYEMGLVVMMRLVFLLYAEERRLLHHGDVFYDQGYGLTYIWHRLLQQKREDETRMANTYDAWDRFLATCRLIHDGYLSFLAYGGRLFNPSRFPVLENPKCKVSNKTFHDILYLLSFARQRKQGEPQRVCYRTLDVEQIGCIYEGLLDHQCAGERRASGAYYTPRKLTEQIIRITLEPLVYRNVEGKPGLLVEPKEVKTARELLELKVCDMAMGSGAFLVQAIRYLGDRLMDAWDRAISQAQENNPKAFLSMPYADPIDDCEGDRCLNPDNREEMILWARRFVVERCIYGVDINPLAVEMVKLSLWLTTFSEDKPFTFLDHALKCGDSLVGVDEEQLRTWSIEKKESGHQQHTLEPYIQKSIDKAIELRKQLQEITVCKSTDKLRKRELLEKADKEMEKIRLAGDLIIAPSFAEENPVKQNHLRSSFLNQFSHADDEEKLISLQNKIKKHLNGQRTFHWPFEFPEVFIDEKRKGFDAIIGNPPFVGGQFIRRQLGEFMLRYLRERWPHTHGTADLVSFFFLRAYENVYQKRTFGLIATNTISQGDTRESGLNYLVAKNASIYNAIPRMPWPGLANVNVSVVHIAKGNWKGPLHLDSKTVSNISTYLDAVGLQGKPERLAQNNNKSFIGSYVLGLGFTMPPNEAHELIRRNRQNEQVLFPYLSGKDLNTHPEQQPSRWVINFFDWPLEQAEKYPDCMRIVREKVYSERIGKTYSKAARERWWQYERYRPELYRAIAPLERVLVRSQLSKHGAFALLSKEMVFDQRVIVFSIDTFCIFALLQSTVHLMWSWKFGATLKTDLNYSPTDCFETFPFPQSPTKTQQQNLEKIGEHYHEHRRQIMLENNEGLTKTYNRFHNPKCKDEGIQKLRDLHVDMDNTVRDAYGWQDLDLKHGWIKNVTREEKKDKKTGKIRIVEKEEWRFTISEEAKNEVLKRLLKLNRVVYEREVAEGLHNKKKRA